MRRTWAAALSVLLAVTCLTTPSSPATASSRFSWTIEPPRPRMEPMPGAPLAVEELPPKQLPVEVDTVQVSFGTEGVAVDVRGLQPNGQWGEWVETAPGVAASLPGGTKSVQARLVLLGDAAVEVGSIDLTAWHVETHVTDPSVMATFRVFATREGLVGGTTANGHVIVERDHFVALPSRRGLAGRNNGNYSVRVCTSNGKRCEWAPVWDVGPWNIKDDYWNPIRASWGDLPRGKPQAQAAYEDGHNGGKDQFGRKVANPAGIDLADGTFWDGLKLKNNAWVSVSYQWTGGGPWGTVTSPDPLNVRTAPRSSAPQVGLAARQAEIRIDCSAAGESVEGTEGVSDRWHQLAEGMYVSAAYVRLGHTPPPCWSPDPLPGPE